MSGLGYTVLGYGAPIMDLILKVSRSFYEGLPGEKGGMELISYAELERLVEHSGAVPTQVVGGSTGNVLRGLSELGNSCALLGKVGRDARGTEYKQMLDRQSIQGCFQGRLLESDTPTSTVLSVVGPTGERTMRAFIGASAELRPEELSAEQVACVRLVHVEGHSFYSLEPLLRFLELAKEAGAAISLDLAAFEVVRSFRPLMERVLREFVDIVFGNEDEAQELTGSGPAAACTALSEVCETAVVMMGREGCIASSRGVTVHQAAFLVQEPVDTTGAGDLFASGFLHEWLQGTSLEACCRLGALCGSLVVQEIGASLPKAAWDVIRREAKRLSQEATSSRAL